MPCISRALALICELISPPISGTLISIIEIHKKQTADLKDEANLCIREAKTVLPPKKQ
jgi:hypothetical protein